jgi:uncharacterized protein
MDIIRDIASDFAEYMEIFPVVGLLGPRQVGKTTLGKNLSKSSEIHYLDLEAAADRAKLADPVLYFSNFQDKIIILDEIQNMPSLFAELRGIIDADRRPGRFVILGSTSPTLIKASADSLAGRIGYLELSAFNITELGFENETTLWNRGGFPLSFLAKTDKASLIWRKNFIKTYIEKDLALMGIGAAPQTIERFWRMLASTHANLWNAESIGRSMGLSHQTINRYLDFMEGAFLIRRLPPYSVNIPKRLVKSPKIYLRDSGILHAFKEIEQANQLPNDPAVGASWEGFVIEQIAQAVGGKASLFFYRSHQGAECDLLLERNGIVLAAIEIKYSSAPQITKGFRISIADTQAPKAFIIAKVTESYPVDNKIVVTNLESFLNDELSGLLD